MQWGEYNINILKDGNSSVVLNIVPRIAAEIKSYNASHPGNEITDFPSKPAWWDVNLLGEYSEEKEAYCEYVINEFQGGQWWTGKIGEHWATVFRCCVGWYNQNTGETLVNDFPVTDGKWYYWDKYSDVWGEYSDAKKTFVLWVLFRNIPGFGDSWDYWMGKSQAQKLLTDALKEYNEKNDPDLPFNFN